MTSKITAQERADFVSFWNKQRQAITGHVSSKTMEWFNTYTCHDNVGHETGQLRPGKLGQWDLYGWLTDLEVGCDKNEALIASGLTAAEVAEEKRRERLQLNFVDPNNEAEVAAFERHQNMTQEELDREVAVYEQYLSELEAPES